MTCVEIRPQNHIHKPTCAVQKANNSEGKTISKHINSLIGFGILFLNMLVAFWDSSWKLGQLMRPRSPKNRPGRLDIQTGRSHLFGFLALQDGPRPPRDPHEMSLETCKTLRRSLNLDHAGYLFCLRLVCRIDFAYSRAPRYLTFFII